MNTYNKNSEHNILTIKSYNFLDKCKCDECINVYLEKLRENKYILIKLPLNSKYQNIIKLNIKTIFIIYIPDLVISNVYLDEDNTILQNKPSNPTIIYYIENILESFSIHNTQISFINDYITSSEMHYKSLKNQNDDNSDVELIITDEYKHNLIMLAEKRNTTEQEKFRNKLIELYSGTCVITETKIVKTLDAAHIVPFCICKNYEKTNGLLLRKDIHTLFDAFEIGINPENSSVELSKYILNDDTYSKYNGKIVSIPNKYKNEIVHNLKITYEQFLLKNNKTSFTTELS